MGLRLLILEAAAGLALARMKLALVPFPRLAKRFGDFVPPSDPRAQFRQPQDDPQAAMIAARVRRAVDSAARNVPFEAVCLPRAMAAHGMLQRRGVPCVMHFGAGREDENPLSAHAWLDAGGIKVTGYPVAAYLAEIACFVAPG